MKKIFLSLALIISASICSSARNFQDLVDSLEKTPQQTFQEYVLNSPALVIVDFYADWCPACTKLAPTFNKLANNSQYKEKVLFVKINYDSFKDIAKTQGIRSLPTLCVYKNGQKIQTIVGNKSEKELKAIIDKQIK